jgi:hypothetical protein
MKFDRLAVFLRHDYAEIWGFRYGLTPGIGILKVMASTGVFVRVIYALKHSTNLNKKKFNKATATKDGPRERAIYEGRQPSKQKKRQPKLVVDLIKLNTYMIELVSDARK